jgi:CubicO group peptidase (beta-lactamase class C family)
MDYNCRNSRQSSWLGGRNWTIYSAIALRLTTERSARAGERSKRPITDKCRCAAFGGLPFGTCLRSGAGPLTRSGFLAAARRHSYLVIGHWFRNTIDVSRLEIMTRTPIVAFFCVAAATSALSAQTPGATLTPDAKQQAVSGLFAAFASLGSPGCAVSVTRSRATLFSAGYGLADIEQGIAITPRTAFYAASVSKQFAAASIGLLVLRGQLSLDADVRDFVPEVPDYGTPITVRHLLYHTSGLRDYLTLQAIAGWPEDTPLTERDVLASVSRQKGLNFAPGTRHLYSNTGYVLISLIVRKISGLSLREFAARELFTPLGMTSTVFRDNHTTPVPRRATAYEPLSGGEFRTRVPEFDVVGDGGLFSTAEDLAKWNPTALDAALNAPGLSALMVTPGRLASGDTLTYAMGLYFDTYRGLPIVRHGGTYGGYRAEFAVVPSADMTIAILCNIRTAEPYVLKNRIIDVYLGDRLASPIPAAAAAAAAAPPVPEREAVSGLLQDVGDLPGTYFSEELDVRWTVQSGAPGGIALQRRNLPAIALAPGDTAGTRFTLIGTRAAVRFERDASGRLTGFILDAGDITGIRFVKLR